MATLTSDPKIDRAAINRANSLLSTGPKTPEGKERIKYNSLKHGCYAKTVVLPTEDAADYEAFGAQLRDAYRPATPEQEELVQKIQATRWRITRLAAIESNLHIVGSEQQLSAVDDQFGPGLDPSMRYALAQAIGYQVNSRTFDQLSRQEARLERLLTALQKEMEASAATRAFFPHPPAPTPEPENIPDGFVRAPIPPMPVFSGSLADMKRKQWLRSHGLVEK